MDNEIMYEMVKGLYVCLSNIKLVIAIEKNKTICSKNTLFDRSVMWNDSMEFIKNHFSNMNMIFEYDLVEDRIIDIIISDKNGNIDKMCTLDNFISKLEKKYPEFVYILDSRYEELVKIIGE